MPYCPSCGKEVQGGERFCPNCGSSLSQQQTQTGYTASQTDYSTPIQPGQTYSGYDQGGYQQPLSGQYGYQQPPVYASEKSTGIALILGLIVGFIGLWGIGQIYVGKIARGIIFLILGLILMPILFVIAFFSVAAIFDLAVGLFFIIPIIYFILWIYQAYDAYKLAQEYNMNIRRTGTPPW